MPDQLFAHPIDTPPRKAPAPIPFPSRDSQQCAFERRARRMQEESERNIEALKSARQSGYDTGYGHGYRTGGRFGFGVGLLLGCALIAASVVTGANAGLL